MLIKLLQWFFDPYPDRLRKSDMDSLDVEEEYADLIEQIKQTHLEDATVATEGFSCDICEDDAYRMIFNLSPKPITENGQKPQPQPSSTHLDLCAEHMAKLIETRLADDGNNVVAWWLEQRNEYAANNK